jgi:hypothetical protein
MNIIIIITLYLACLLHDITKSNNKFQYLIIFNQLNITFEEIYNFILNLFKFKN